MANQQKIGIVLVEDHAIVRQGIRHILEQCPDFDIVGEAGNAEQAIELIQKTSPDILLCDIRLGQINGITVVRQAKRISPNTKALVLSAYDDDEYVFELMLAGASGYLLKTTTDHDLAEAIRKVYSGEIVLDTAVAAKIALYWAEKTPDPGKAKTLSPRELEVLAIAASGSKNKAIAKTLGLSTRTVEHHFMSILTKLSAASRSEAIQKARSQHILPADTRRQ